MSEHITNEELHDLVEGELAPERRASAEEHLAVCAVCRAERDEVASVVEGLAALPRVATPPAELWAGIEARIGASDGARDADRDGAGARGGESVGGEAAAGGVADHRHIAGRIEGPALTPRRFAFSPAQLAAAAAVVAFLSAGTVWLALSGPWAGRADRARATATPPTAAAARMVSAGDVSYRSAAQELEAVLEAGRNVLAPETLAALEASLRTIDQAIAEVEAALAEDPASDVLGRMLVNHQGARLRVLRKAATLVQATL